MLDDPGLDPDELTRALRSGYGIHTQALTFVSGYDPHSASYDVAASEDRFFLKVRFGSVLEVPLAVPHALLDAGVPGVLAPMRTRTSRLWATWDDRALVLYPFIQGRDAMTAGMTAEHWRTFGTTLRAVHDSGLDREFRDRLPLEDFSAEAAAPVRGVQELAEGRTFRSDTAGRLAAFLRDQSGRIDVMIERAQELGNRLRARSFDLVLCHADIHAANIMVTDDGGILLVDWDGPKIAPRERDLLFVIGSRIARAVEPHEEALFFEGYGAVDVDAEAIVYYRYERILEDIGVDGESTFLDASLTEATRREQTDLIMGFFAPGGMLESVERV